ncbi:MAG: undecaprenyl-diphosphatase, partial [Burkholderiaceae bacterium]|nr:undecaprenyl-diphosphatase [Burkholderiaceae bacterium]
QKFVLHVVIACIPAMGLGLIFGKFIKAHLFSQVVSEFARTVSRLMEMQSREYIEAPRRLINAQLT